jgi:hypothetical protein
VGTREASFRVQVLIQRCRNVNFDVYSCLIDYEKGQKAFDRVKNDKIMNIFKEFGLDSKN